MWVWKPWKRMLTVIVGLAGIGYAAITYWQWHDLRRNFEIDQRALVRLKPIDLPDFTADTEFREWPMRIMNTGKSPALGIKVAYVVEVVPAKQPPSFNFNIHERENVALLFPSDNDPMNLGIIGSSIDPMKKLPTKQIAELTSGASYLAAFAQISYRDQFGSHWTQFCVWKSFSKTGLFTAQPCLDWNNFGDGPPPHQDPRD